jgi:Ca2+-binding EF-hand superfamily protein
MFNEIKAWFLKIFDKNADGKVEATEVAAVVKEKTQAANDAVVEAKAVATDISTAYVAVKQARKNRKAKK